VAQWVVTHNRAVAEFKPHQRVQLFHITRNLHCLVLVGSRIRYEYGFIMDLKYIEGLMVDLVNNKKKKHP